MKAISTKILPATNTKPARLKAYDSDGNSYIIGADSTQYARNTELAHKYVARSLANQMGWPGTLVGGGTKEGYVFVFLPLGSELNWPKNETE